MRPVPEPVKGVKDARLLDEGVPKEVRLVRVVSMDMLAWLIRLFSVCSLISPRLEESQSTLVCNRRINLPAFLDFSAKHTDCVFIVSHFGFRFLKFLLHFFAFI